MSSFEELEAYVSEGSLRIISAVGVPRSMSTALGRALNESGDRSIFINEPFNRQVNDVEAAAESLLRIINPILCCRDGLVTVITKSMANYIDDDAFIEISRVSDATIWNIRHPLIQMGSLLTRIANDIAIEPGSNFIMQDGLEPYLEKVTATLASSPKSEDFSKTGWSSIGRHYLRKLPDKKSVVVDGEIFTANPVTTLSDLCDTLDLSFSPSMIDGWKAGYTNLSNGDNKQLTSESAWTREAATNARVVASSRAELTLVELPPLLKKHITKVAIPVYEQMMADNMD